MTSLTRKFIVGSRGSELALVQSKTVIEQLKSIYPSLDIQIEVIKTKGDKILDISLSKIGGQGLFTKELEVALINKQIDFAVHSLKDLPTKLPEGLIIGAVPKRHLAEDCLVVNAKHKHCTIDTLPTGAVIGSSSLRRVSQLKRFYPHFQFTDIRGNLNTRLRRLDNGEYDALILAVAGLSRLGLQDRVHQVLPKNLCMHAVGQGALAIECREDDAELLDILRAIHDNETQLCCEGERAFLAEIHGGCQIPVGVTVEVLGERMTIYGIILSIDGSKMVQGEIQGDLNNANEIGRDLAVKLKNEKGNEILKELFDHSSKTLSVDD